MREYTVSLRIFSKTLTPDRVASRVGLQPTYQRRARETGAKREHHVWEFEPAYRAPAEDFPGRVTELLDALRGYEDRIVSMQDEGDAVLWAACFSEDPEVTVRLPPELMRRLSSMGIELSVSVYACS